MRHRAGSTPRPGFTMVELLVVIAIIVVLVALTLSGISYVRQTARQTQTVNDIRGLDEAVTTFKNKFGFVPPSHVVEYATDGTGPYVRQFRVPTRTDQREYQILRDMYKRWNPVTQPFGVNPNGLLADGVTINPAIPTYPARAGEILDNNQAMVYFLAGPTNQGWSHAGPTAPTGNSRIEPFYEFPVGDQLVVIGTGAPRYHDHYGIPYAYFSSNIDNGQYNPAVPYPWVATGVTRTFAGWGAMEIASPSYDPTTDATATKTAHPLRSPGGKWLAAGRVQIISAGRDKMFGFGSPVVAPAMVIADYSPGNGNYQLKAPGDDDISNFSGSMLGVGQ